MIIPRYGAAQPHSLTVCDKLQRTLHTRQSYVIMLSAVPKIAVQMG